MFGFLVITGVLQLTVWLGYGPHTLTVYNRAAILGPIVQKNIQLLLSGAVSKVLTREALPDCASMLDWHPADAWELP